MAASHTDEPRASNLLERHAVSLNNNRSSDMNMTSTGNELLNTLREQKEMGMKGGIYHKTQIDLTYNSNHIEGSRLTHEQTRFIFETNTIGMSGNEAVNVNDIIETVNHFRCVDLIIDHATEKLSAQFIKQLHGVLKSGTTDSRKSWFAVGEYKRLPNEVGGETTCPPEQVEEQMEANRVELNKQIAAYEQVARVKIYHEEFEKTPKKSIKRFLYQEVR